jgi:hypothetical protein
MVACHSQFLLSKTPVAVLIHVDFVFLNNAVSCWDYTALVRRVGGMILTEQKRSTRTETRPSTIFSITNHACVGLGLNPGPPR